MSKCAKTEHQATLQQRMDYLESFLGESADKHAKELQAQAAQHQVGLMDHKTSMETRLEYLEALLGDSADKHSKEITAAQGKLADLHIAIQSCAKAELHGVLEERILAIESLGFKDLQGEHSQTRGQLGLLQSALSNCARSDHHETLQQRLAFLETAAKAKDQGLAHEMQGLWKAFDQHTHGAVTIASPSVQMQEVQQPAVQQVTVVQRSPSVSRLPAPATGCQTLLTGSPGQALLSFSEPAGTRLSSPRRMQSTQGCVSGIVSNGGYGGGSISVPIISNAGGSVTIPIEAGVSRNRYDVVPQRTPD